jgi:hypothetical protein
MPLNALQYVSVDHKVPLVEIGSLLVKLTRSTIEEKGAYEVPEHLDVEVKIAKQDPALELDVRELWERLHTPARIVTVFCSDCWKAEGNAFGVIPGTPFPLMGCWRV